MRFHRRRDPAFGRAAEWTLPQFALNWVLSRPGITSAIVGASRPEHIADTLEYSDERLTEEELKEIDRLSEEIRG